MPPSPCKMATKSFFCHLLTEDVYPSSPHCTFQEVQQCQGQALVCVWSLLVPGVLGGEFFQPLDEGRAGRQSLQQRVHEAGVP